MFDAYHSVKDNQARIGEAGSREAARLSSSVQDLFKRADPRRGHRELPQTLDFGGMSVLYGTEVYTERSSQTSPRSTTAGGATAPHARAEYLLFVSEPHDHWQLHNRSDL